ncbi:hypothetical protein SELMODRAFT_403022 [Selaginella moellendorffii]|uniref:Uncharacterized protein n=1 Tax=Selaginella moellendorffii TaxID=88036 RepID=D8QNT4_SELML|nr:uncharacterized protein LOC9632781 [Selaginella moellendorffii]EFJ38810.1 hypothetical protein SELMODRAFT_403022 [Selaginella moellendorffii]|eukprot:XP_002961271.1 uncharacterized protein LOC9632781 [Selaginella moellendorffii]
MDAEVVRGMLRRIGQEYVVDFTFGESMVHDPVTERDYFPLIMSLKDFGDGFTMTGGRFYPADEEGVRCTAVILDDAEDAERNQYMFSNVQKVSKDGEVLESTDWEVKPDWRKARWCWKETQDEINARIQDAIARGAKVYG